MRLAQCTSLAAVAALLTAFGCSSGGGGDNGGGQPTTPQFAASPAFEDLRAQVAFGPRNPGGTGHDACRRWLVDQLAGAGAAVREQTWTFESATGEDFVATNVIGEFAAAGRQDQESILLGAHWDTRPVAERDPDPARRDEPILGANDGASGVAVLLELARQFQATAPSRPVTIVFFDLEDLGLTRWTTGQPLSGFSIGSRHFANNLGEDRPAEAIIVDMVGDANLDLPRESNSVQAHPQLVNDLWARGRRLGFTDFLEVPGQAITDDHIPLIQLGVPAIDIIDFDYPGPNRHDYWHTHADTPDHCSPASLRAVGQTILDYLYAPASRQVTRAAPVAAERGAWLPRAGLPAHSHGG